VVIHDRDGDQLGPLIRNGRPDQCMPGSPTLSAAQIADIATFLRAQASTALRRSSVPKDYPVAKLLTGNGRCRASAVLDPPCGRPFPRQSPTRLAEARMSVRRRTAEFESQLGTRGWLNGVRPQLPLEEPQPQLVTAG